MYVVYATGPSELGGVCTASKYISYGHVVRDFESEAKTR